MNYRGKKVLVTGADGFIGSHLAEALARHGADVTALCQYNSFDSHGWLDGSEQKLRLVRGDVRDPAFIGRIVRGQEIVFHLAALIAIPHSYVAAQSYVETNVLGTLNVLEACREARVGRLVQTSTSEVYGSAITVPISEAHRLQGQSPYSASKIGADMMAEAFARSFDLPVVILRPFNTFGPRQSERAVIPAVIRQLLDPACPEVRVGDLTMVRDFSFVDDTVAAFMTVGEVTSIAFGTPYNSGSGKAVSIGEMVDLAAALVGCTKPLAREPGRLRPPNSEVLTLLADAGRLAAATDWRPRVDFAEGLRRTIRWWRTRLTEGLVRKGSAFVT